MMPMKPPMDDEEDVPPSQMPGMQDDMQDGGGGEDDMATMMDELDQAGDAGEQYAGDSFFAPVPGAEGDAGAQGMDADGDSPNLPPEVTKEVLEQLLAKLPQ